MEAFLSRLSAVCEHDFSVGWLPDSARRDAGEFLLLREMHRRVANSFAVVCGILRREFASSAQPELQESLRRCEARIVALGNLHRFLTIGGHQEWISVQFYIERLCEALVEAVLGPMGVRREVCADDGIFRSEHCELLGLIIAELATNAAKHAFRERDDRLLRVEFINNTDSWVCVVSDNGVGSRAMSSGVGSRILESLLQALDANLVRKSGLDGTSVAVTCQI
jgi:two-component sensor histidine kinase